MEEPPYTQAPAKGRDFVNFWRIPEGDCELLSAHYSTLSFGRHSHDRYAIGVISAGAERLFYRGRYALGGAGSVVTISPGEIHDGLPGSDQGWTYRMLYIDPQWVSRTVLQERFGRDHIHLFQSAINQAPPLAALFLQRHQLIEHCRPTLERETLLLDLIARLFEHSGVQGMAIDNREPQAVRRIRQRLEEDFDKAVSLEELAQMVNLDASFACGFFDQSHMSRAFKKVVGMTPGNFRRLCS